MNKKERLEKIRRFVTDYQIGTQEEIVEHLKEAINLNNIRNIVSTVYSIDEDNKQMGVHCKAVILFVPSIINIGDYLKIVLDDCFKAHDLLKEQFIRLNFKQEKHESPRVVVKGFN